MNKVFYYIKRYEKKNRLLRRIRRRRWYLYTKIVLLSPLLLIAALQRLFATIRTGRVQRNNQPDIVFKNIVSGFANLAFPDEQIERMAKKRAKICAECPAAQKTGIYSAIIDNRTHKIQGMKCDDCGCNLSAKVRSLRDSCPRGKW